MLRRPASIVFALLIVAVASGAVAQTAQIGNLEPWNPPSLSGFVTGDQAFAYLVHPDQESGFTSPGFELLAVHMLLEFLPGQVPAEFDVSATLMEAVWDPQLDAWVPGSSLCQPVPTPIKVLEPGVQTITAPVASACGCRPLVGPYFLMIRYDGPFQAELPVDEFPQPGVAYWHDLGAGWDDMYGLIKTATGKVIIWGDIITCMVPVGAETSTWGGVKSLFR